METLIILAALLLGLVATILGTTLGKDMADDEYPCSHYGEPLDTERWNGWCLACWLAADEQQREYEDIPICGMENVPCDMAAPGYEAQCGQLAGERGTPCCKEDEPNECMFEPCDTCQDSECQHHPEYMPF